MYVHIIVECTVYLIYRPEADGVILKGQRILWAFVLFILRLLPVLMQLYEIIEREPYAFHLVSHNGNPPIPPPPTLPPMKKWTMKFTVL